jgi:hypothetical protein
MRAVLAITRALPVETIFYLVSYEGGNGNAVKLKAIP